MDIIVNGTSYPTWDEVPQDLKTAIANSGSRSTPEPPATPVLAAGAIDIDDIDQLVVLAEAAELRRAQGLPPVEPVHAIGQVLPETLDAPSPVFELNGQRYNSIEAVPGEIREALRHELLATPPPARAPKVPKALAANLPTPPSATADEGSTPGAESSRAMAPPDPMAPKPPMISRPYKVAMGVMITMIVAIYLALSLLT